MFRLTRWPLCPGTGDATRHGAEVNGIWADYGPPIIAACEGRSYECMNWLLTMEHTSPAAARESPERSRGTPSSIPHFNDKPELLTLLLQHGANPNALSEARGEETGGPRRDEEGKCRLVRILLGHGANRHVKDEPGVPLSMSPETRKSSGSWSAN